MHPLDRPVHSALTSGWAHLALQSGTARQLDPAYGPFAVSADLSSSALNDLSGLRFGDDGLWLVEAQAVIAPHGTSVRLSAPCHQMTAAQITPGDIGYEVINLTMADAPDMLALAHLTRPGPFAARTHELSQFIGVRQDGRLVAMAGERMKIDGFSEVSGVCTHPDYRGQGYAAGLMRLVACRILDRGETPFLHSYATNTVANALYETLGFSYRRTLILTILDRG